MLYYKIDPLLQVRNTFSQLKVGCYIANIDLDFAQQLVMMEKKKDRISCIISTTLKALSTHL